MPTQAELEALTNSTNCDVEWIDGTNKKYNNTTVTGRLFTGKGAYSSCSVFLPAAGCYKDGVVTSPCSEGDYWSSTPRSGNVDRAYLLLLSSGGQQVLNFGARKDGYSVRAVLTE